MKSFEKIIKEHCIPEFYEELTPFQLSQVRTLAIWVFVEGWNASAERRAYNVENGLEAESLDSVEGAPHSYHECLELLLPKKEIE